MAVRHGPRQCAAPRPSQNERIAAKRKSPPTLMRVLLKEVIVPRRDDDSAPAGDSEYFGREIHEARQLHKEWARAQLNGLPDDERAITEWIKLTQGQRPDLAAELPAPASRLPKQGYDSVTGAALILAAPTFS